MALGWLLRKQKGPNLASLFPPPPAFWLFACPSLLVPVPLLLLFPDEKYKRKMRQCPGLGSPSPQDGEMKSVPN